MSTHPTDLVHHNITASISTLGSEDMEMENSALADTPNGRVQRLVTIYGSIKPLLLVLTTLVILPPSWRDGIKVFVGALDAVAVVAPQFDPDFKAGKDLK
jgi:hypothetical protein